jgi:hypothetical protein
MRRSRRLIVWAAVPLLLGGCLYSCLRSFEPTIGHAPTAKQSPVEGLPQSATNARNFLPGYFGPVKAYEFDVSEKDFEAWVASLPAPKLGPSQWRTVRSMDETGWPYAEREIADGPVYSWQHEDQSIVAAYDRSNGRAYYRRSYR